MKNGEERPLENERRTVKKGEKKRAIFNTNEFPSIPIQKIVSVLAHLCAWRANVVGPCQDLIPYFCHGTKKHR